MNYLSIPHYRGTKEKYDESKHSDGIFFTTDTHEIIANDTAYNELIKDWSISDGDLIVRMTSGKTYEFNFPNASETERGIMSPDDKKNLNRLSNSYRDLGNFQSKDEALNALSNIDLCSDSSICHIHCTYSDGNVSIDCQQSILNTYCRQVIFHEEKYFQRNITFTDESRTAIESMEDWACLFGDRLKWHGDTNKYILNQLGLDFNDAYTDPIPLVTYENDGLMSKEDKKALDGHIKNYNNPHQVNKTQVGLGNVDNTSDKSKPISDPTSQALGGKIDKSQLGVPNGVAQLDDTGKIPSSQLPSYVDEILEFQHKENFPKPGQSGKIYVERTTNLTYRWSEGEGENKGDYVEISPSIGLGETPSTAYPGDKGAAVTERVRKLAEKKISHVNDDKPFTQSKDDVTFNYTCFTGSDDWQLDSSHNPSLPVADASHAGILTGTDYTRFNLGLQCIGQVSESLSELSGKVDDIETVKLPKKVDNIPGKGLSTNDFTNELKQELEDLNSWNYIGILSSWNGIAKLTTESTEADILTALAITPLRGNKTTTKEQLFATLDKCAINKKFLKESSTNAIVFVEFIGSCYVIQIIGNKAAALNGRIVGTPVIRHITISGNSTEDLKVLKNPFEIKLEDINKKITEIENNINNLSIKAE